jgi:hypothetical protein
MYKKIIVSEDRLVVLMDNYDFTLLLSELDPPIEESERYAERISKLFQKDIHQLVALSQQQIIALVSDQTVLDQLAKHNIDGISYLYQLLPGKNNAQQNVPLTEFLKHPVDYLLYHYDRGYYSLTRQGFYCYVWNEDGGRWDGNYFHNVCLAFGTPKK